MHLMAVRCISSIARLRTYVKLQWGREGYFLPKGASQVVSPLVLTSKLCIEFDVYTYRPTVCLGATYVVAYTYGYDGGRIEPTHCALIDAGLGDRSRQRRACSRLPAGA